MRREKFVSTSVNLVALDYFHLSRAISRSFQIVRKNVSGMGKDSQLLFLTHFSPPRIIRPDEECSRSRKFVEVIDISSSDDRSVDAPLVHITY